MAAGSAGGTVERADEQSMDRLEVVRIMQQHAAGAGHGVPVQRARVAHEDGDQPVLGARQRTARPLVGGGLGRASRPASPDPEGHRGLPGVAHDKAAVVGAHVQARGSDAGPHDGEFLPRGEQHGPFA